MSNELQVFRFQYGSNVTRVLIEDGELWICARDVTDVFKYPVSEAFQVMKDVPGAWKGTKPIRTPGGEQEILCLSEQGLYFFLSRSGKPGALNYMDQFMYWMRTIIIKYTEAKVQQIKVPQTKAPQSKDIKDDASSSRKNDDMMFYIIEGLKMFKDVMTPEIKKAVMAKYFESLTGYDISRSLPTEWSLPLDEEMYYTATELSDEFGVNSPAYIGMIANEHGLKAPKGQSNEYGKWLPYIPLNTKKLKPNTWVYSERARKWFRDYFNKLKGSCSTSGEVTQLQAS